MIKVDEEQWKQIKDYPKYEVSNYGNIRNKKSGRILKQNKNNVGYSIISLSNKKCKTFTVHRLVAEAFLTKIEGKNEINHLDENKQNNRVDNLQYCDRIENMNYGEVKEKIAKSKLGKPHPHNPIWNANISKGNKGKKRTEQHNKEFSDIMKEVWRKKKSITQ